MSDSSEPWLDTVNIVSTLSEFGNCSALTRFPLCTIQYLLCICIVRPVPERLRTNTHTVTAPGVLQDYLFLTGLLAYFSVEATVLTEVVLHLVFKLNSEITYLLIKCELCTWQNIVSPNLYLTTRGNPCSPNGTWTSIWEPPLHSTFTELEEELKT